MKKMGNNGIIGKSGKWYHCEKTQHIQTALANQDDVPFVLCRNDQLASSEVPPNNIQFEAVMEWCTQRGLLFEDIATGGEWNFFTPE